MSFSLSGTTITQSGTDTDLPSSSGNGFTVTTEKGYRRVTTGSNALIITGNLTIPHGTYLKCGNSLTIQNGGRLLVDGTRTINGTEIAVGQLLLEVDGTATSPTGTLNLTATTGNTATLIIKNAHVLINSSGWSGLSVVEGATGTNVIRTQGDYAYIMANPTLSGTDKKRIRINMSTPVLDFQATKTVTNMWLNFPSSQTSLSNVIPIDVDGFEINGASITTVSRVDIENYNSRYIVGAYYPNTQLILFGGEYVRLINNLNGTNMTIKSSDSTSTNNNIIEYYKKLNFKITDSIGNALTNPIVGFRYTNSYPTGYRPKGITTDITGHNTNIQKLTGTNSIDLSFCIASGKDTVGNNITSSNLTYFCDVTTAGAETHRFYLGKYGYKKINKLYGLSGNEINNIIEPLTSVQTVATNADALNFGVSFNFNTRTVTLNNNITLQNLYDSYQANLYETTNIMQSDEWSITGNTLNVGTWNVINNNSLSSSSSLTSLTTTGTVTGTGILATTINDAIGGTKIIGAFTGDCRAKVYDNLGNILFENTVTGTLYIRTVTGRTYTIQVRCSGNDWITMTTDSTSGNIVINLTNDKYWGNTGTITIIDNSNQLYDEVRKVQKSNFAIIDDIITIPI